MIDFTQYTYQQILQTLLDRVPDTYDKRDGSPIPTAAGMAAYGLELFYIVLNEVQREGLIQTATGNQLDLLSIIAGTTRYQASPAVRLGIFDIAVPIGSRFSTINGENSIDFYVSAATTGPTEGDYYYQLTAETPGDIGNDYTGPILPITAIPGLTSAQITDILVPGDDTESDDEYRERVIEALNDRPFAGNIAAYRQDILAIDGVGAVQVYPTWNGGGTVKCSILGADFLAASPTLVENVQTAIDPNVNQGIGLGLAPIGAQVTITTADAVDINVVATLLLSPGYSIQQVQPFVEQQIENYLLSVRQEWDTNVSQTGVQYAANVYVSRVISAIVNATGVVNVMSLTLNGSDADITLTEAGVTQQIPVMGTVTLSES